MRVGVIDDHPAVLLGVTAILNASPDLHVVATAASAIELLDMDQRFDLILLDLALTDGSTPSWNVKQLEKTGALILAYTSADQSALIREASRAGVVGMIRKTAASSELVSAVTSAGRGEIIATAQWASALDSDQHFVNAHLSPRESEVLALYAAGETAERVATELFISRETVLDHIRRIRAKYARADRPAPTKVDLFRRAIEDGLIAPR